MVTRKVKKSLNKPDKQLSAVCGLFCPACTIYIATKEGPQRLKKLAELSNLSVEDMKCYGCRSEKRIPYCEKCKMAKCTAEKGIDFCGECKEYPCEELEKFQSALPHRIELWESQERIKEVGYEKWFEEMVDHYSCRRCNTINSAYDIICRSCGADPGCAYVGLHIKEIITHPSAQKLLQTRRKRSR
jgi:hypothetical protein